MRRSELVAVALIIAIVVGGAPQVQAQFVREHDAQGLRSFHGGPSRIRRSFQSDAEANTIFKHILVVSGLAGMEDRITIRATEALVEKTGDKEERLILYNAEFMQAIARKDKNYWSMVAILAHEVGHHVRYHTVIHGHDHKFELEADYQAGFILRRDRLRRSAHAGWVAVATSVPSVRNAACVCSNVAPMRRRPRRFYPKVRRHLLW